MKTIVIPILLVMVATSCNQLNTNSEKTIKEGADTISKVDISVSKVETLTNLADDTESNTTNEHRLLFTAHGSEPGWYAQFYTDKLRLIVDYGKDSVLIDDVFEKLDDAKGYSYAKAKSENGEKYSLSITIDTKPCVYTASGDTEDRGVIVKLNNKTYKGCGSFTK